MYMYTYMYIYLSQDWVRQTVLYIPGDDDLYAVLSFIHGSDTQIAVDTTRQCLCARYFFSIRPNPRQQLLAVPIDHKSRLAQGVGMNF